MRRLLRSTALALLFSSVMPCPSPDLFIYRSAYAAEPSIPDWIQASCCGPQDVHRLRVDQVHRRDDGWYLVDGYNQAIAPQKAQPSQDSNYWIFYRDDGHGSQSGVFCFFEPMTF